MLMELYSALIDCL